MLKKITLVALCFLFVSSAKAIFYTVALTGFNADVVANGAGSASLSTTADVDGVNYAFMAADYNPAGTPPIVFLPTGGLINSLVTSGLSFQLAGYSSNNSLRLPLGSSGTLTFVTPQSATDVYVLGTTGSGSSTATITVTFTDASTQVFTAVSFPDWYDNTPFVIQGVGRCNISTNAIDNNTLNPRLYQKQLAILSSNYSKLIQSVSVTCATTTGVDTKLNIMGISVNSNTPCVTPTAQPTALVLNASASAVNISFTAASPAPDKYLVVRTPNGNPLSVNPANGTSYVVGGTLGNGTIVSASNSTNFLDAGLSPTTTYRYTIFAYNDLCSAPGPLYNTTNPLTGTITTNGTTTYIWNGSISTNWTVAGNWTPARNVPDASDILQFNNGIVNTVTNIPTQTISRLLFSNSTTANFQAPATNTLTLNSDNNPATNELDIAAGSSLISNGTTVALTILFGGTGATANVAGNLESVSTSVANIINFSNSVTTVTSSGSIAAGGTSGTNVLLGGTTSLIVNGTYNHKYTTASGPAVPTATWNTGSTVLISGYTTATGGPNGGMGQTFSNFTYNCPAQTSNTNWSGTGPLTVTNNFTMASTGTGSLQFASTQGYTYTINNYIQTGGTLDISSGTPAAAQTLNISGVFTQTGGVLKSSGAGSSVLQVTLNFNGTSGVQNASFFNVAPIGPMNYRISNPNGINLSGTGTFTTTPTFLINNNGGVRISTLATNPINTTLTLNYSTGTTLTYDANGSCTATASVWPAVSSPANLSINTGGSANIVTAPFSRTISGLLTFYGGDLDMSSNTLTLGTSVASPGVLAYIGGSIRLTTGSFVRWYGTTGLPTGAGTGVGYYPIAYGGANRNVSVYFSTATALSAGGTIAVSHANVLGMTTGLSIADAAYTINTRTNSNWTFAAANGLAASGTISIKLTGLGLFTSSNPANLRAMLSNNVVGTHSAGSGVSALRTALSVIDLTTAPFYIGAAAADIGGVYTAINTGLWSVGSTWDIGFAPTIINDAYINSGVTVTADATTNAAKSLNILAGGTLNISTGKTVTLDSALANNGIINITGGNANINGNSGASGVSNNAAASINISAGAMTIGPAGGSNKPFSNAGTLSVSGGALNVNGNFVSLSNSTFNQTGGNINVDGNAAGVAANSVAANTVLVNLATSNLNLTGGTFTIVDPHANATSTRTFDYNVASVNINIPSTYTIVFGDGVSADAGGSASFGYRINEAVSSGRMSLGNVIINGATGTNRFVSAGNTMSISGDLTINNGGEYRALGSVLYLNKNLTVNTGGILTADATIIFASYFNATQAPATNSTLISGSGTYRNSATASTANFTGLTVQNSNGISLNIVNPNFSGIVTFVNGATGPSKINMISNSILIERAGAGNSGASQANGWVNGRYQKAVSVGALNHNFPVGDASYYTPVVITGTATAGGDIWVGSNGGDHPNINTSTINTAKTVNRNYSIQALSGVTFTAGSINATLNWNTADLDPGATPANFKVGAYASSAWTYPTFSNITGTSIQVNSLAPAFSADYQIGEQCGATVITSQPAAQTTVCSSGGAVSISVAAAGSGLSYQWQKNGVNISGATGATYNIASPTSADNGNYTVVISSACGSVLAVTSSTAVLTVNDAPSISTQPQTQTICQNSPVTFNVTAAGTGITYQWQKNGINISGATLPGYSITSVQPTDAGNYSVVITGTGPCTPLSSANAVLTVNPLSLVVTPASSVVFCSGSNVVLNAATGSYSYQWKQNGVNIPGQTGSAYTATTSGDYSVFITNTSNGCSGTSTPITVTANSSPPATITPSGNASFCQGSSINLNANAGTGLAYQWKLAGVNIPGATNSLYNTNVTGSYTVVVSAGNNCSTTSAATVVSVNPLPTATATPASSTTFCQGQSLTINANTGTGFSYQWQLNGGNVGTNNPAYSATAAGNYTVTITDGNNCSQTSSVVSVTVNPLPTATILAGGPTTFCQGQSVTLNANTGTGFTYQWKLNTADITGATASSYSATQAGTYTVKVTNANNCSQTSSGTSVTVNALPPATVTPTGPVAVCQGGSVLLTGPSGSGQTYQWLLNGSNITGATSATYSANANGNYSIKVTNTATTCSATSPQVTINIIPLPPATINPSGNTAICQGDTLLLTASVGTGFTYQWKLNTVNISGATNATYKTTTAGSYTVVVTNSNNCSATSLPTVITVNPSPPSNISYTTPVIFCEGGAVVLNANTGTGYTYQWNKNGTAIPDEDTIYTIINHSGYYTVTVTNSFHCSTVSPGILVTVNPLPVPVITRTGMTLTTGNYINYQWYFNGNMMPGANTQSYTATQNGSYYVRVTDNNGCSNVSTVTFVSNVGIGYYNFAGDIKIYPNPAKEIVNIESPVKINIILKDLWGRTVMTGEGITKLDISRVANGAYMLLISDKQGHFIKAEKLLKSE